MNIHQQLSICIMLALSHSIVCADTNSNNQDTDTTPSADRLSIPVRSDNIMQRLNHIDIHVGGKVCYASPEQLKLVRTEADKASWMRIQHTTQETQIKLIWPAGQTEQAWPTSRMPVEANVHYLLSQPDGRSQAVYLYQLPDDLADEMARDSWMQEKGCL